MAEESPTVPHLAELDIPEHFLPVDPLKDPCHRQPAVDGEVWCYRRSLVVELSTLLDLDEDVVVDMTVLRDRISQCERWEKTLNDVLALELSKRRDLLRRGNDMIEAASREVCLALVATVNSRRALRSLVERKVYSPTRTLALARRRHRLILVKERIMDVARMSRAYKAYRSASTVIESIHAAIRLQQLLTAGIELPCWMKKAGHDWTHPSELLADTKSTLYERLKPLAVVDDLSSLQKAYVETLSGYWQLIISYTDVGSADINPAADMCSIFCNLVGTIARQCLLAATNFGGRVMDEIAYTGRKTMPASELCQLLDPREFPHFLHRLLEVFLTLIIRYDRLVTWHDSFKGCDVMTDDDPHLIEFINNLSAELTARRDMVLDRVNNQLQSLLESFDSVTGCPLSIASNVCGLLRVFSHATTNGSGTTGALEQVISRLVQSIIRDVSLRVWDADLLPLAQRESWNLLESSDPLIPSPRRLRGSITGGVEGLEALSKPSVEAAIYDPDLGGVSSMVSPRWPLLTQATANRMGELLQLGVVHPSVHFDIIIALAQILELYIHTILGLFVVRHPTFDDVVNGGHHSRGDMKDRHAIYEGHDKHIANAHYRTLSRQCFKLRQLVSASGRRYERLLLAGVPPLQKLTVSTSLFGLKERCSAIKSCDGLLAALRHHLEDSEVVEEMQERYVAEFLSTCSVMVCELRLVILDDCAASIVNKSLAAWTQHALRNFGNTTTPSNVQSPSDDERRASRVDTKNSEADTLLSGLDAALADARRGEVDPCMVYLLAVCMYRRVAQQAGEIIGLVRPMDPTTSERLYEYLSNISASLVLPEGNDTYWDASDLLTSAWRPVLEYAQAFQLRDGVEVLEWCKAHCEQLSLRLLAALITCVCPNDAMEGGLLLQLEKYVLEYTKQGR